MYILLTVKNWLFLMIMKYIILFFSLFLSIHTVLSAESIDTVQWVNNVLMKSEIQSDPNFDSALIVIRQSPKNEYKKALSRCVRLISEEKTEARVRLWYQALMVYNDNFSYNVISSTIVGSADYVDKAKWFCDSYNEIENKFYAPLRLKFDSPSFVSDSFVLDKKNISDFTNGWFDYSSSLMERDKNNPINQKFQEYFQWKEKRKEERYVRCCVERDSLYSTKKRKHRERISDLEDEIKDFEEERKLNVCVLPRTIDVCYSKDSFVNIKERLISEPPFRVGCLPCKDSLAVIVPYLTSLKHNEDGGTRFLLLDYHITSILGQYAEKSKKQRNEIWNLFRINVFSWEFRYYTSFYSITALCCRDGVVLRLHYEDSGGQYIFIPNDKSAEIIIFNSWVE